MRELNSASYRSSLSFLLVIASKKLFGREIILRHSISDAYYWEFADRAATAEEVAAIATYIEELVKQNIPLEPKIMYTRDAIKIFLQQGQNELADLLRLSWIDTMEVYFCKEFCGFYYAPLVERTGELAAFKLFPFADGMCLQFADKNGVLLPFKASHKVSKTFINYSEWLKVLGVSYMNSLHREINAGNEKHLVLVSEAFHAQEISNIAEAIAAKNARIVTIAGPSSSGKTTFSERLKIQLCVCGKKPFTLPMDNYFLDRGQSPVGEDGQPNFEIPEALDIKLLEDNLSRMMRGEEVQTPRFDFLLGKKVPGKTIKLGKNDVLIMEGIHGLNDKIIGQFPIDELFTIFAAPMTGVCLDPHNRTSTSDNRLMRRMVRDHRTRGYGAEKTLLMWSKVVAGAAQYIFPYEERADAVFNSSLPYELAVLKNYVHPLLHSVPENSPAFSEVHRLQRMLKFIPSMNAENIPNNSVLREFIGGTCFEEVEK